MDDNGLPDYFLYESNILTYKILILVFSIVIFVSLYFELMSKRFNYFNMAKKYDEDESVSLDTLYHIKTMYTWINLISYMVCYFCTYLLSYWITYLFVATLFPLTILVFIISIILTFKLDKKIYLFKYHGKFHKRRIAPISLVEIYSLIMAPICFLISIVLLIGNLP